MADLVVALDHPAARLLAVAGGKGASLARMSSAGLPVPEGFIVTASAFRRPDFPLSDDLEQRIPAADPADLEGLERLCGLARQGIVEAGVPRDTAEAVAAAYRALGEEASVSVRSSATSEDQPWASFAGQYDTFLNVTGLEALLDRLRGVWASLYSTRAVAYGKRLGVTPASTSMAVVVQRQLRPQAAGVMFTRYARTGEDGRLLVNVALGLGEGVVTGDVPTDTFSLDGTTFDVVAEAIGGKDAMMEAAPGGGVRRVPVPHDRREAPAMTHAELAELGRLAGRARGIFGGHLDIESAAEPDAVHLLQARPIAGDQQAQPFEVRWENPADSRLTWARASQAVGVGRALTLQQDAIRAYLEGSRACFDETGAPMARSHLVRFFNGYPYVRAPQVDEAEVSRRQERGQQRDAALRQQGASLYESEIRPQVEQWLAQLAEFRPRRRRASLAALEEHLEDAMRGFGEVMGDLHWRMAAGARLDWPSEYRAITGEPEVASGALLQAIPNRTTRLARRLRGLAQLAQDDPDLLDTFRRRAYDRLWDPALRGAAAQRFRARFRSLLRDYGLRNGRGFGSGTTFTTPTWNMSPQQPLDLIAVYIDQDIARFERLEASAVRARRREERRVRRILAGDRDRLSRFDVALGLAVENVKRMENHNHIMEQGVAGALREAIHWMGLGLVRDGHLDDADDAFHLSLAELRQVAQGQRGGDLRQIVTARAEEWRRDSRLLPPPTVGSGGPSPINPMARYDLPSDVGLDGSLLRGVGASPGMAQGRARVTRMDAPFPEVRQGDILVAQNAGPAWTPVFPLLGGVVLDKGAVFQHAALVAREYGIPAVIMTRDATAVVVDGQTISVDADRGIVDLSPPA